MKTLLRLGFLVFVAIAITQPVHGQRFLKKLKEKVEERIEESVEKKEEEKVNEAIDEQINKVEESRTGTSEEDSDNSSVQREERMQNMLKGFGISGDPVPYEDNYRFDHLIQMHVESFDKNGKKEGDGEFITHFNMDAKSMAYEMISGNMSRQGEGTIIIDTENGALIMLGEEDGKKTGIVYGMGAFFDSVGKATEDADIEETPEAYLANPNVKKTGRTKTIAGYKCEEYKYSDENTESFIWITKELNLGSKDYFSTLYKSSLYSHGIPWGAMMEVTSTERQSGEKSFMQVTRVDENSNKSFSLSGYQISNLGSFKIPEEK